MAIEKRPVPPVKLKLGANHPDQEEVETMLPQSALHENRSNHHPHCCQNCGHTGRDVTAHADYIGGHGYTTVYRCENVGECWQRWDKANRL